MEEKETYLNTTLNMSPHFPLSNQLNLIKLLIKIIKSLHCLNAILTFPVIYVHLKVDIFFSSREFPAHNNAKPSWNRKGHSVLLPEQE